MPSVTVSTNAPDEEAELRNLEELVQAVDLAEIEHAYQTLELEEARIEVDISDCISNGPKLEARMEQLLALHNSIAAMSAQLAPMQSTINATAVNADVISKQVRFLDRKRDALEHALATIKDTEVLKARIAELLAAMEARDIDAAANLVHEYAVTSPETLDSPFIRFAAPPSGSTEASSPRDIVAAATQELVERVSFMFDTAIESNNTREIGRCFRLFPLLGEELRGLDRYSDFLCSAIAEKSRFTGEVHGNIYALRVTRLFEAIAAVIDNHFPLVERHYGTGRMLRIIQRLQMEGARRACMALDFFEEERQVKRRLAEIQQSSMPDASASRPEDKSDFKEITSILAEIVLIMRQIAAFNRFMESRAASEEQALDDEAREQVYLSPDAITKHFPLAAQAQADAGKFSMGLVAQTPLTLRSEWLTNTYVTMETYFIETSVAKAMALDDTDSLPGWDVPISSDSGPTGGNAAKPAIQQTSSCVGDVFFVAKTALEHAIAIQQPVAVEAIVQNVIGTLNAKFLSLVEHNALERWPSSSSSRGGQGGSGDSGWRIPGVGSSEAQATALAHQAACQRRILAALNNLDLSCSYLQKTVDGLRAKVRAEWAGQSKALESIDTLAAFSAKFTHARQRSLDSLGALVLKPWMRTILQQSYRDMKYVLTDEEFNDMQNDNLFQQRFVIKFRDLAEQLRPRLSAGNYKSAVDVAIGSLTQDWERAIRQSKFNMLGGIMFEKDVREIRRYLEQEAGVSLRSKFARLAQMADVLAVETNADKRHVFDTPAVDVNALTETDIKSILANRIDIA
ncbi:Golgi transport complex subunit 4 [Coemansia sp. RSA 2336]|nr:Golgi transport complex subunit 4 [Coemansia sp. RSA 2336]